MKRQGFTLIELLAVIVVLAIIALIATPTILGVIEKAKKGAAESSALAWVNAVENQIAINLVDTDNNNNIVDGTYTVSDLLSTYGVSVKGKIPAGTGTTTIANGKVSALNVDIDGYSITYDPATGKSTAGGSSSNNEPSVPDPTPSTPSTPTMDEMCPGCEFVYTNNELTIGFSTAPEGTTNDYTTLTSTHPYFLGLIKNASTNLIERAFVCGVENGTPFCLEGYDTSKYADSNIGTLNTIFPSCNASASDSEANCNGSSVLAYAHDNGTVNVREGDNYYDGRCVVDQYGAARCDD